MFRLDQTRVIPFMKEKAMEDRMKFKEAYEVIEHYIKQNDLILGDKYGLRLLLQEPRELDEYVYDVYVEKAMFHAYELANRLAEKVTKYVAMRTTLYGREYSINVDTRELVRFYRLDDKGFIRKIMRPANVDMNGAMVNCVPADYHLIEIYRQLYFPDPGNWGGALENEDKLYRILKKEYDENPREIIGGKMPDGEIAKLKSKVREKFLSLFAEKEVIIVGDLAVGYLLDSSKKSNVMNMHRNLQILTTETLTFEFDEYLKEISGQPTLRKSDKMNILSDFRLTRTILYMIIDGQRIPVLYAYNSLDYDVVPFTKVQLNVTCSIGNPFVVMRYLLIESVIIKMILAHGKINKDYALGRIKSFYDTLFKIRNKITTSDAEVRGASTIDHEKYMNEEGVLGIFQPIGTSGINYKGTYYNEYYEKKLMQREMKRVQDYIPAAYKKEHGSYKVL